MFEYRRPAATAATAAAVGKKHLSPLPRRGVSQENDGDGDGDGDEEMVQSTLPAAPREPDGGGGAESD